jgi:hypothetical protein
VNPETDEVGELAFAKLTVAGLDADAVQIPVPLAERVVVEYSQIV